jgi:WhiB family redox-sensing transcriptional regulator
MTLIDTKVNEWVDLANCASTDPEAFFPSSTDGTKYAMLTCKNCVVKKECLRFAMDDISLVGIWGGTTRTQRIKLRRKLRKEKSHD